MKIAQIVEDEPNDFGLSITHIGGPRDGEMFTSKLAITDEGTRVGVWTSNARSGYFKRVFVPFDFEHEAILK